MRTSLTLTTTEVDQQKVEIAERLREAVTREASAQPVKTTARDAALTEGRVKQIRAGDAAVISAPSLIMLARKRPELRSLLFDLLSAEVGDGEHPAVIMDRIARMFR